MTTHQLNGHGLLIVDVPEGTICVEFSSWSKNHLFVEWLNERGESVCKTIELPPGKYSLLLTEEDARKVVTWYGKGDGSVDEAGVGDTFWCYDESDFCFDTAIESLHSWIRSRGKDPKLVVCLLKNN